MKSNKVPKQGKIEFWISMHCYYSAIRTRKLQGKNKIGFPMTIREVEELRKKGYTVTKSDVMDYCNYHDVSW